VCENYREAWQNTSARLGGGACPMSQMTIKNGVERILKIADPEVKRSKSPSKLNTEVLM